MGLQHISPFKALYKAAGYSANAEVFTAGGPPNSDITAAVLKAFTSACQAPAPSQVVIPKGDFKLGETVMTGPCKSPIEFTLQGNVKADGGSTQGKDRWVVFEKINGFKLNGGGTLPERYSANAEVFTAGGPPNSDITAAVLKAFTSACQAPAPSQVVIPKGDFKLGETVMTGPCKSPIEFTLQGNVKADGGSTQGKDRWVVFEKINGFKLNGGGTFDGEGNAAWKANNCHKTFECKKLPISVRFDFVDNAEIKDVTSLDAKNFHFNVISGKNMTFDNIKIIAPAESPNTDGIHLGRCEGVKILNTKIATGDDCISVGDGMKNLLIEKVVCGPGHGISVGSLGRYGWEQDVTDITVKNCTLEGTDNGLRIKTWPSAACTTTAAGIHFEDIILNKVSNPILIDQEYCPWNQCNKNKPSTIKLVDITFRNIRGTSGNKDAVKLLCSKGHPCENVEIGDINIEYTGPDGPPTFECTNVTPKLVGAQNPKACVGPVVKAPGKE
ncbi:hypothetical protein F2Q69_00038990 [Brassica cretica]|uniref:Polygalacturonase n=1 Tax=Brassica cretica TaxID=69181 RepID=A0A8S9SN64_BRACR|nr:hypothetical protein F2Q69_00038990 [Brassica cretica]